MTPEQSRLVKQNWNLPDNANLNKPISNIKLRTRQYDGLNRLEISTYGDWLLWNQQGGLALHGRPSGFSSRSISDLTVDILKELR